MSGFLPVNPRPMLVALVGKEIRVRLKWGYTEYTGALVSADSYMNLQLANTEEFIDGKSTGSLGQVLIRCNNVLWIAAKDAAEDLPVVKTGPKAGKDITASSQGLATFKDGFSMGQHRANTKAADPPKPSFSKSSQYVQSWLHTVEPSVPPSLHAFLSSNSNDTLSIKHEREHNDDNEKGKADMSPHKKRAMVKKE